MMYVCNSCKGESASRSNRNKPSTCEDCDKDNPIIAIVTCACSDVGHDKTKLKKIPDIPTSLFDEMKVLVGKDVREIERDRSSDAKV